MSEVLSEELERLLWGAVANAGRLSTERKPRWSHVADALGVGSTKAHELCRRFDVDPDEERGSPQDIEEASAAEYALDAIAKLCGCSEWEYPGQVVRDVETIKGGWSF